MRQPIPVNVLVSGKLDHPDFRIVRSTFAEQPPAIPIDEVAQHLDGTIDLLVLLLDRSGILSPSLVHRWMDQEPLIPIVAVLSSLCEGELRSPAPWPGVTRLYWHKWQYAFNKFLWQREHGLLADWNQPKTALPSDRLSTTTAIHSGSAGIDVLVSCSRKMAFEAYADELRLAQCNAVWLESLRGPGYDQQPSRILIDGDGFDAALFQRLKKIERDYPDVPRVLVLGFPRSEECEAARRAGIDIILSKPLADGELTWTILSSRLPESFKSCLPAIDNHR